MEATLLNDNGSYFWETPDPLVTEKGEISVFLDGPLDGPSEKQVAFWQWLYVNSETLAEAAQPLLRDRLREFGLDASVSSLVWSAAGLSTNGNQDGSWDMSFTLSTAGKLQGAILTAYFENGVPTIISLDD